MAARTSLNRPTGPRRRLTTVELPLMPLLEVAHRRRCKLNDLILVAVTGALAAILRLRGEEPSELVVSVPISARRAATADQLGNQTGVVPLAIPTLSDQDARLQRITAMSHSRAGVTRGTSAGPMGLVFRAMGALGIFQVFIDHQRLVHTFVTNVRGPQAPVHLAGYPITTVIPLAITPGNVGVCFDILSYAGGLVVRTAKGAGRDGAMSRSVVPAGVLCELPRIFCTLWLQSPSPEPGSYPVAVRRRRVVGHGVPANPGQC